MSIFLDLIEQVLIPNIGYNGQKLIRLVIVKIAETIKAIIPKVPDIVSLINKIVNEKCMNEIPENI
jgi:hypothetical protein